MTGRPATTQKKTAQCSLPGDVCHTGSSCVQGIASCLHTTGEVRHRAVTEKHMQEETCLTHTKCSGPLVRSACKTVWCQLFACARHRLPSRFHGRLVVMGDGQVVQQTLMLFMLQAAAGSTILDATVKVMSLRVELGCTEHTGIASMQRCQAKSWDSTHHSVGWDAHAGNTHGSSQMNHQN